MKFGLTNDEYGYITNTVVIPLEALGATVWCFGSRARGNFNKFSDLDLMIQSDVELDREISVIKETLQNSNFPYKVDIVQQSEFASEYKHNFEKEKTVWKKY